MHPPLQLFLDSLQLGTHPVSASLPFKLECASSGAPTDVGKSEKVERLRFAKTSFGSMFNRIAAKLNQPGLVRMQRQCKLLQPLSHIREKASGIDLMLKTDNTIVGIAHNDDVTLSMVASPPVCPEVEDVMEIDVGQQGRYNPPCGVPTTVEITFPSSITPAFSHLRIRRIIR